MGKRGDGYGSEDHLLRYWHTQRVAFENSLLATLAAPGGTLSWEYPNSHKGKEPQGLNFLNDSRISALWKEYWPQTGRAQTWDGIARLRRGDESEWILMEAKANTVEFVTPPCAASKDGGRTQIEKALNRLKSHLGVHRYFPFIRVLPA